MKRLRSIKGEEINGMLIQRYSWKEICINVESIWNTAKKRAKKHPVDSFIKRFCEAYVHEALHFVIEQQYRGAKRWLLGEEIVIFKLMDEKFYKKYLKCYKEEYKWCRSPPQI